MREDALARTSKVSHDKKRKVEHQVKDDDEQHDVGNKRQRELVSVNGSLERSSGCPQEVDEAQSARPPLNGDEKTSEEHNPGDIEQSQVLPGNASQAAGPEKHRLLAMEPATATIEGDLSIAQDSIAIPALSADPADAELVGLAAGVDSLAEVAPADTVCQALEAVELAVAEAANLAEGPAPVAEEPALGVTPVTPAPSTGKHYKLVVDALRQRIEPASDPAAVAGSGGWPGFSDYLGEGAKARLETVAALHLSPGAAELCPDAVRQLAANSSRILLGAATNCDLYQERLVRALARRVGARFLAVDAEVLHLGAGQLTGAEDGAGPSEGDEGGGAGAYDSSEDDFDDDVMDLTAKRGSSGKLHDEARALDAMRRMSRAARFVEHQVKKNVQEAGGGKETKKNGEEQAAEPAAPQVEAKRPDQGLDAKEVAAPNAERAVDGSKPATEAGGDGAKAAAAPEETAEVSSAQDIPDVAKKAMAEAEAFAARKFLAFTMSRRKTAVDKKPQAPDSRLKPADDRSVSLPGAGTLPEAGSLRHHILQMVRLSNEEKKGVQPGDRVCYVGPLRLARNGQYLPAFITDVCSRDPLDAQRKASSDAVSSKGPETGATGQVVSVSGGVLTVAMDEPFPGGMRLPGCKDGCGWTGSARQFSAMDDNKAAWNASFQALFDVIKEDVEAHGPLIVMVQAVDRMVRFAASYQYLQFRKLVATLPPKCLFVGAYTTSSLSREKAAAPSGLSIFFGRGGGDAMSGGPFGGDEMPPWMDRLAAGGGGSGGRSMRSRASAKGKLMTSIMPNNIELHPPHADVAVKAWKKMVDADVATMRERANRRALAKALAACGVACDDLNAVKISELHMTKKEVEHAVGAAVAKALLAGPAKEAAPAMEEPVVKPEGAATTMVVDASAAAAAGQTTAVVVTPAAPKLTISAVHLNATADAIQKFRTDAVPAVERSALKDVPTDQYERQLMSEVIPPEEIAVGFDDIGALESVKNTLHEVVILPLQRPELFTRGALTRPTKGLLLFGPPGTGKTMLAKAVASASGAHFINVNMSAITSKWFGEGERLVRAVFSIAHKLAPSVIFVDEIDSFLSRRTSNGHQHEAMRKMQLEFMQHWDGLRTKATDRVLVLAATNRPMDLDDAVIRRMPRRILVPLPDVPNREKILKVILKDENLDPGLDIADVAQQTDGYSGSDLKNLCIAAAYCPVRDLLDSERAAASQAGDSKPASDAHTPSLRPITKKDFEAAMSQVTASTHAESATMADLKRWNDQFGEGGSRRSEQLAYYT